MRHAKKKVILTAACILLECSTLPLAHANCPTLDKSSATAKYVKAYVQNPQDVGTSWRLYMRPRNGACLYADQHYVSPTDTKGQSDGKAKTARVHPGSKNCSDKYKSYIGVDIPSASAIYDTFVNYEKSPTLVGFNLQTTLKSKGNKGAFALVPMMSADGTPSKTNAQVIGICFD